MMTNNTAKGLADISVCPSFNELPDLCDADSLFLCAYDYDCYDSSLLIPTCNWCYLSEIVSDNYHWSRPSALVKDRTGRTHPIVFYLDNDVEMPSDVTFFPGYTLALLYPHRKMFFDWTVGIRVEDTDCKVFKCSLRVLLDESKKLGQECCYSCGKSSGHLLKCGKCMMAKYCNKECQSLHWKCHKSLCGDMKVLDKLVKLVHSPYQGAVTFQQLESNTWGYEAPKTEPKTTSESLSSSQQKSANDGFILMFDVDEDLFFACFDEKSSWKCEFRSLSEECTKSQLKSMLENPKLLSVIIETVGGRHWNEILNYYRNGGFIVFLG